MTKKFKRTLQLGAASFDADTNTIEVVWSTGATVRRVDWWSGDEFDEQLSLEPGAVRLDRLNAGAPFLATHRSDDLSSVLGTVVPGSACIVAGRGVATIQLSRAEADADVVGKLADGIIRNISIGYWIHDFVETKGKNDISLRTVVDWEPLEISAVPVPADAGAQVRSLAPASSRATRIRHYARLAGLPRLGERLVRQGSSADEAFRRLARTLQHRCATESIAAAARTVPPGPQVEFARGRREAEKILRRPLGDEMRRGRDEARQLAGLGFSTIRAGV